MAEQLVDKSVVMMAHWRVILSVEALAVKLDTSSVGRLVYCLELL